MGGVIDTACNKHLAVGQQRRRGSTAGNVHAGRRRREGINRNGGGVRPDCTVDQGQQRQRNLTELYGMWSRSTRQPAVNKSSMRRGGSIVPAILFTAATGRLWAERFTVFRLRRQQPASRLLSTCIASSFYPCSGRAFLLVRGRVRCLFHPNTVNNFRE